MTSGITPSRVILDEIAEGANRKMVGLLSSVDVTEAEPAPHLTEEALRDAIEKVRNAAIAPTPLVASGRSCGGPGATFAPCGGCRDCLSATGYPVEPGDGITHEDARELIEVTEFEARRRRSQRSGVQLAVPLWDRSTPVDGEA